MIDFLYSIYIGFIFGLRDMVLVNLPASIVARLVFLSCFMINLLVARKGAGERTVLERELGLKKNWRSITWFFAKEAIFIAIGFLHGALAIAVTTYSFMAAGTILVTMGRRSTKRSSIIIGSIAGWMLKYVIPGLALAATIAMAVLGTDRNATTYASAIIAALAIYAGKSAASFIAKSRDRETKLPEHAFKRAKLKASNKVPRPVKILLASVLAVSPLFLYFGIMNTVAINYWTVQIEVEPGVFLSTDIYRSVAATDPQPVILIRSPYSKRSLYDQSNEFIAGFIRDGYTVVYQDMRGRFESTGSSIPFLTDRHDGAITVSWIKNQTWCNGKIASWGGSALAINQYLYADEPTGALAFQSIMMGTPDFFETLVYQGGAFRKSLIESWVYGNWITNRPFRENEYQNAIDWILQHPLKNESWANSSLSIGDRFANVTTSALHWNGWYDIMSQGTLDGFTGYQYNSSVSAQGKQRLIMGPIGHGEFGVLSPVFNASSLHFPRADESKHAGWERDMRDWACLGGPEPNWSDYSVAYYLMGDVDNNGDGANRWYYDNQWPVAHANQNYYLQANGTLATLTEPVNQNHSFLYDPSDPVLTRGGNNLVQIASLENTSLGLLEEASNRVLQYMGIGPYDQQATGNLDRDDVLVFSTPALASPVTIVGRVQVRLHVSSNCTDTAFTVMLLDEYANGSSYNVLDGILVMRARDGLDAVAPEMEGNQTYEIVVDLWSTAYQFNTGHKIKIAISSSNYPRFERHPNTSDPVTNQPVDFNVANNTIHVGGVFDSAIILPVKV